MCIQHLSALSCQTCIDATALCWSFWEGLHALQMAAASQRCSNLLMTDLFEVFCASEKWTCFQSLVRDRVMCHLFDGATGFCRERCSHIYAQVTYMLSYMLSSRHNHITLHWRSSIDIASAYLACQSNLANAIFTQAFLHMHESCCAAIVAVKRLVNMRISCHLFATLTL